MKRPLLSVVIPTWNRVRLVCEAIESALAQRPGQVEVIVVDDGSTDNTADELGRRFGSRIRLLRMLRRGGIGAARNAGVREASGELLAFLDSDDLWLAGKLEAELQVFDRLPGTEAIVSDSLTLIEGEPADGTRFENNGLLAATQGQVRSLSDCPWLWGHWQKTITICSMTLRRDALARLGQPLFPEDLIAGEDWELEMRIYHECRVAVLPEVWSHIRRFDDGTRPGRACPGKPLTPTQRISVLQAKLKTLERTLRLNGLDANIAAELESCRLITVQELAPYQVFEGQRYDSANSGSDTASCS
jgi:glycosyltransferase involved in cell wall biosynthesis